MTMVKVMRWVWVKSLTGVWCQVQTAAVLMQFIVVSLLNNASSWIIIIIIIINVRPSLSTDWMIVLCVIQHHVEFHEWRPILPSILTKCPLSSILGLRHISYLLGAQTGTWSGDVKTPTTADSLTYLHIALKLRRMTARNCERRR